MNHKPPKKQYCTRLSSEVIAFLRSRKNQSPNAAEMIEGAILGTAEYIEFRAKQQSKLKK